MLRTAAASESEYEALLMKPVDLAFALGSELFSVRHPRAGWPGWFESAAVSSVSKLPTGQCLFEITIPLMGRLGPNQSWKEDCGDKYLVQTDPKTGSRSVILSMAPQTAIRVFEASIDPITQSAEILYEILPAAIEIPADHYLWGDSPNA